ncbi:uncharacterized protein LOC132731698 [Ruditapes philippinarum]|uniref:uncharacterized protein LOC132731698 n=1 Tax=Ruditapes philippinarum TaxID=129788 RepID=UPI00295B82A7|nr:uncharacterized protein LOC132731698 [Ruditapes philippinarum]
MMSKPTYLLSFVLITSLAVVYGQKDVAACPLTFCQPNEMCFNLDTTGAITGLIPGISHVSPMTPIISGKPCSRQIVIKAHFLKGILPVACPTAKRDTSSISLPSQKMLKIQLYLSNSERYNHMFNIGDSHSNNGHGGDSGHQSYDSEIHGRYPHIGVYGNDHCFGLSSIHLYTLFKPASLINVWVSNGFVKMSSDNGLLFSNCSSCLFGLNGQLDAEGIENEDIFISANRVINTYIGGRVGYGICFMKLRWVSGPNE